MATALSGIVKNIVRKATDSVGLLAAAADLRNRGRYWLDAPVRSVNSQFRRQGAPDGLPLPPPFLSYLVTSVWNIRDFYNSGVLGAECIKDVLNKNGLDISAFRSILDFGCGCGRILRHWKSLEHAAKLTGVDYNSRPIIWCKKNLPFAEFGTNKLAPPLSFPDSSFDFAYSISVFTHMPPALQDSWLKELFRVLRPGGYLLFTIHGKSRLSDLAKEHAEKGFELGRAVTVRDKYAGTNYCGAFHPEEYVRTHMAMSFNFIDFVPAGAKDANQDMVLFQKPCD
jgi:SAM-dependent methyltransferase